MEKRDDVEMQQEEKEAEDVKDREEKCGNVKGMNAEAGYRFKEENHEKKRESKAKSAEEMDEDVVKNEEFEVQREKERHS